MTRTLALCIVLGWQGGTAHQVAFATGLTVADILDTDTTDMAQMGLASDYSMGWFAARTNDVKFNREKLFPKYKGNLAFWMGAAAGKAFPEKIS